MFSFSVLDMSCEHLCLLSSIPDYIGNIVILPHKVCEVLRSACLWVCLSSCISQKPLVQTKNFLYMLSLAVSRSSFMFFLLWMMPCFHIMGQIQLQAWSLRCSELFTITRQVAPLNCAPGDGVCCSKLPCSKLIALAYLTPCGSLICVRPWFLVKTRTHQGMR